MLPFLMIFLIAVFVPISKIDGAILDPVDFLALQSIHRSLADLPGSTFMRSWDFTGDPCGFPGVLCGGGRVVALSLGDPRAGAPGLTGRIDPAIGRLAALEELSLVPGRVSGPIPWTLSQCTELKFLALSHNYLTGRIPASLSDLKFLRTLDLSSNILSGTIPATIFSITTLSNIVLSHNRFFGKIPATKSSQLVRLDLKRNFFSGQIPPLPVSLRYLSLSNNLLTGRIDRFLCSLSELNYLDLSINRLSGPIPGCVFLFPLTSLQLQRNAFVGPVHALGQVGIQLVDLSHNRLSGKVPAALARAQRIYLNDNRFEGQLPQEFMSGLVEGRIELLYLQHNFITSVAGLHPGSALPAGGSLCLQFNCMNTPADAPCPLRKGHRRPRPPGQCPKSWEP